MCQGRICPDTSILFYYKKGSNIMSNVCNFNKGDYAYFDVEGISDKPEVFVVQIIKRKTKTKYIVMSVDTGEVFETRESLLCPYINIDKVAKMVSCINVIRNSDQICHVNNIDLARLRDICDIIKNTKNILSDNTGKVLEQNMEKMIIKSMTTAVEALEGYIIPKFAIIAKRNKEYENIRNATRRISNFNEKAYLYAQDNRINSLLTGPTDFKGTYFEDDITISSFICAVSNVLDMGESCILETCKEFGPDSLAEMNKGTTISYDFTHDSDTIIFASIIYEMIKREDTGLVVIPYWNFDSECWEYGIFDKTNIDSLESFVKREICKVLPYRPIVIPILKLPEYMDKESDES